ncbi:MAG TPA: ATP-binding protein [Allosphingosinicella sp.]|nr:ATP-binding protein [Allosphingosinicella sp.]
MSKDHLGLFDTPPGRGEVRLSFAVVGLLAIAFFLILPWRDMRVGEIAAFIPTIDAEGFVGDLITATLLYAQASIFRSHALTALASGYLFAALLLVGHALTFPGAFSPAGLLGAGLNTTGWIGIFQRAVFPIVIILYVLLRRGASAPRPDPQASPRIALWALAAIALAASVTLLTTLGHDLLPAFYVNRSDQIYSHAVAYQLPSLFFLLVATTMLFRTRTSVLDIWLLVALSGWMIQTVLIMLLHRRFTVGFYCLFVMLAVSHLVVMLALIAESNRLYARLAVATAARDRERDARLMTMDAVTAAIAHEVGQPLTGVVLYARGALNWLDRASPDLRQAIASLRATIDAGHNTMAVIKSIRAMFAKGSIAPTTFSLNDLVRETASFLEHELAGEKVAVEFTLDEALPSILADRIQIQRVLVNLFTNAIESLRATQGRRRCIAVRSAVLENRAVVIEMSDTGLGITPDDMPQIFEAFFTTKEFGTGLGLSLCRAIVEEHGGRLWASSGTECGATFHLELRTAARPQLAA